ncbi:MAG: HD domain-containing protein [Candidatus Omnitrophica bacterium]|nr:HD domain-containing protein [Candidatus Omnitrophota bacterium]
MAKHPENHLASAAIALGRDYRYEEKHCSHVADLALSLFDQLKALHRLETKHRQWLAAAAILHDIGWTRGQQKHHKTSCALIIRSRKLPLPRKDRVIIGLIARYHRKSLPKSSHKYFAELDPKSRDVVTRLAAFLRLADGLDRTHLSSVEQIVCGVTAKRIDLEIKGKRVAQIDVKIGKEKSDMLKVVFQKNLRFSAPSGLTHQINCP